MANKIATISLNEERKPNQTAKIFVAQPSPNQENLAGRLFMLIEIEAKKSDAEKIINFIISDINDNYYQNEKLSLREKIDALKIENIFETVLVKTNKNLLDYLAKEKIQISARNINATIGIIYENKLHFSNIGKNKALLLYKEEGEEEYQMINVEKSEEVNEQNQELNFKKLFASIVSGEMPQRSYFIFTNEALSEYLFNKELINIVTKLAPEGAAMQIQNTLAKINSFLPFFGLIIKNNGYNDYSEPEASLSDTISALASLSSMETETEKILAPKSVINSKKISINSKKILGALNPLPPLWRLLKNIFRALKPKKKTKPTDTSTPIAETVLINTNSQKKSKKFKILLAILSVCLLAFLANLFLTHKEVKQEIEVKASQNYKEILEQKINQIDSYLLYNNEESAKTLITEVKDIIAKIPEDSRSQIDNYNDLMTKFDQQVDQIQHIAKIENLKEITNLNNLSPDGQPDNIKAANGYLYIADGNKKTIYKINLKDNVTGLVALNEVKENLKYPTISKDGLIYYYDNKQQVIQFNPKDDKVAIVKIALNDKQNIVDIDTYNNRLYVLDQADNQIYRFSSSADGFTKGETRLKDKIDLNNVVDFAIDNSSDKSYVYFLKKDGGAVKFYDGKEEKFSLDTIEPVLNNPLKIMVLKYIYILEPANKRLIIFDKSGKFVKQYQADQFSNLKDMTIDEAAKKAYILNDKTIYEIGL